MEIFTSLEGAGPCGRASAVACGYFDGLHVGHAAVIGEAVRRAREAGICPSVFTFTMDGGHPAAKEEARAIITDGKKYHMLEKWGIKTVLSPGFGEFMGMSPAEFVDEVLVERLHAAVVCCGADFRFGSGAAGDTALLRELLAARGIEMDLVPEVDYGGERVSSTRIRALLGRGEVETAGALLGRAFSYDFMVVPGKRLGRTIDSPTINQRFPEGFVRLRHGVYASVSLVSGRVWPSVTNIGLRPTVERSDAVNSETYLYGFSGDLYGQRVEVRLLRFLRDELKFSSVEELKERIQADTRASLPVAEGYIAEKYGG